MIEMTKLEDGSVVPTEWCSFTNPLTSGGKSEIDDVDMKCFGECDGECDNCDLQKLFNEYAQLTGQTTRTSVKPLTNMEKSIFIIETPACCGECPMSGTGVCRKWNRKDAKAFPKDCPLVRVPRKKFDIGDSTGQYTVDYRYGWNECIDEIFNKREGIMENEID